MGRKIVIGTCLIYEGVSTFHKATTRQIPVYEGAGGAQSHAGNGAGIVPVIELRKMTRDKSGARCSSTVPVVIPVG